MADFSFFKELHAAELTRRDSLNASLSFPVGILTLAGGAVFAMSAKVSAPFAGWTAVLGVFLAMAALLLGASAYCLVRAYWNYTYKHLPLPDELLVHRNALIKYHVDLGENDDIARQSGTRDFLNDLEKTCAEYGRINALNNESKSARIFRANSFLIGALAATILCTPIFAGVSFFEKKEPSKVQITNAREFIVNTHQSNSNPPPGTQQTPQAPTPVRPTMPPGREIKEHVDPNKRK